MKLAWQQQPRVQLQLFLGIVGPPHRIHNVYIYTHSLTVYVVILVSGPCNCMTSTMYSLCNILKTHMVFGVPAPKWSRPLLPLPPGWQGRFRRIPLGEARDVHPTCPSSNYITSKATDMQNLPREWIKYDVVRVWVIPSSQSEIPSSGIEPSCLSVSCIVA